MIKSKSDLKDILDYESKKYGIHENGSGRLLNFIRLLEGSETQIIWKLQKRLRKTEFYYNTGKKLRYRLSLMKLNKLENRYGIHIGVNICDRGLKIMHLGSVLVNGRAKVGKDVCFHINTALVGQGVYDDAPMVGDGVIIGVGSILVGGITIANNVAIGAGAVVVKDVEEENIAVAGVPAKKVSKNGSLTWNKGKSLKKNQ